MRVPSRSTRLPSAAAAQRTMGPKTSSTASAAAKVWTNVCERKKSSKGTGGDGAVVIPVLTNSSAPSSAMNLNIL